MVWDIYDQALYNPKHIVVKHMYDSHHAGIVWFGFVAGQVLRDHDTTSVAVIQVLRGHIRLTTETERTLSAGQSVQLLANERHALTALEDALVQLILIPHPRYHSLAKELQWNDERPS